MTVIVGTKDFIAGDRRVSDDSGDRIPPCNKVFRNESMVVGIAGFYSAVVSVKKKLREGASTPEDLIPCVGAHSQALCLHQGKLYDVSEGCVTRLTGPVQSVGSGSHAALGVVEGARKHDEKTVRRAVRFAAKMRADCGDGVRVVRPK